MPRYRTFQTSFTSGEFDQKLRDRTDIQSFFSAAQLMRNYALLAQGGFTRRCGTILRSETTDGRLFPFIYSSEDALIINFDDQGYTVYDLSGNEVQARAASPYLADELFEITYVQRGNALIMAHRNHPSQVLRRDPEANTFTIEDITFSTDGSGFSQQPFSRKNKSNATTFAVGSLGYNVSTTMTSSQDYFLPEHVGSLIRLEEGMAEITAYTDPRTVTIQQIQPPQRTTNYEALTSTAGSNRLSISLPEHGFTVGQTINLKDFFGFNGLTAGNINGSRTVVSIFDSNTFTINVGANATASGIGGGFIGIIEFTGTSPVLKEQSFSEVNGYPNAVAIHDQRLWFGGTIQEPDGLWASVTGQFDNFDVGRGDPTDAISVRLDDGVVNEVRHLVSSRHLQILTNENEYFAPSGDQTSVTPATFVVRKQTPYGSSRVRATLFDGATMFLQNSGRSLREFLYTDREFAYNARNIAILSQHLIENPKQMDAIYGGLVRPEQYVFMLNETGTVTVLHSVRSEEIIGFAQWEAQGPLRSVCVVGERVFCIHQHPENGLFYLEEFDFLFTQFMDGVIGFESETPTNTWGPAPEYANQEVAVTADGYFLGYTTVAADGTFTSEYEFTSCEIGLNFPAIARTMQAAFSLPDGPMTGLPVRLTRAVVDFGSSNIMDVENQSLILRRTADPLPQNKPAPFDQKEEFWLNIISRQPSIDFVSNIPLESTVYSAMIEIAF